jgi:hypothetical protein
MIAAALASLTILAAAAASGNRIFSPGELNAEPGPQAVGGVTAHIDLEHNCAACHPAFWAAERMGDRCVACHTNVAEEIQQATGLHGGYATTANCRDCHTEHQGREAVLWRADMRGFPHERTGYLLWAHPLNGSGGIFLCADCHPSSLRVFEAESCLGCHRQLDAQYAIQHRVAFGADCVTCHDGVDSYGSDYDHGQSGFALLGGHAGLECVFCHRGATTIEALRAAPSACRDCHAAVDIHEGRLGSSCGDCHTPSGWEQASLDHALTRFALSGRHVRVECEACHVNRRWVGIGTECRACHSQDDRHQAQFAVDCADCHTAEGWDDITFSHARSSFPLEGAHASVDCAGCHPGGRYVGTPSSCIGCHADDDQHNGQFGDDCSACHRPTRWEDWTFDHDLSAFPLTGAHRAVNCQGCHSGGRFDGTPTSCAGCHSEPASHGSAFGSNCGACHSTSAWRPASFNGPHPFPMNHGDAGGNCGKCHPSSLMDYTCYGCHDKGKMQDKHKEITSNLGDCVACHARGDKEEDDD